VQGEQEQKQAGRPKQQLHEAALDIATGVISGNLVAYAIIVCTSATLFTHHQTVSTAADAARALSPLLGPYAKYLFALGFIGAGLVAIPVLLASTSYTISGTFGWPASLWNKPWQNEGFYLILTGALLVNLVVSLLGIDPVQLMFWANVLQGVLTPVLVVLLLLVGNNRTIMGAYRLGRLTNIGLILIALVMAAATILLFYGLLFGSRCYVPGPGSGPAPLWPLPPVCYPRQPKVACGRVVGNSTHKCPLAPEPACSEAGRTGSNRRSLRQCRPEWGPRGSTGAKFPSPPAHREGRR
jgi:hypothetical protein